MAIQLSDLGIIVPQNIDRTGTLNATTAIQNAIDKAYTLGGYVLLPPGRFKVNTLLLNPEVEVRGSGWATRSGTNPINEANYKHRTVLFPALPGPLIQYLDAAMSLPTAPFGNMVIHGNGDGTVGLDIASLAYFEFHNMLITGFTQIGINQTSCILGDYKKVGITNTPVGLRSNPTGNVTIYGGGNTVMQANANTFTKCWIQGCSQWAVDYRDSAQIVFNECDFELNGTSGNTTTGCIKTTGMSPLSEGVDLVLNHCWFEENRGGYNIDLGASNGRSIVRDTTMTRVGTDSVGAIKNDGSKLLVVGSKMDAMTTSILTNGTGVTKVIDSDIGSHAETAGGLYLVAEFAVPVAT